MLKLPLTAWPSWTSSSWRSKDLLNIEKNLRTCGRGQKALLCHYVISQPKTKDDLEQLTAEIKNRANNFQNKLKNMEGQIEDVEETESSKCHAVIAHSRAKKTRMIWSSNLFMDICHGSREPG